MKRLLAIALLGVALAATSAMAAGVRITGITPEHARPNFDNMTVITLTFSNGTTENYNIFGDHKSFTPQEAADLDARDTRLRSWRVGDFVEIRTSMECFMGDLITNVSNLLSAHLGWHFPAITAAGHG